MSEPNERILGEIFQVISARKTADPETSYTARLFTKGLKKIAQKLGEEAVETVVAAVGESDKHLVSESADLLYHLLVLWSARGLSPQEVWAELDRRFGVSGIAVKYVSITDFAARASDGEIGALIRAVGKVAQIKGVADPGYRLLANIGAEGGQVVPHLHFHVLGGRSLGAMLVKQP